MKSESERVRSTAIFQTALVCLVVEVLVLLVLRPLTANLFEAVAVSVVVFGPLSVWLAPPLYRYLQRENR